MVKKALLDRIERRLRELKRSPITAANKAHLERNFIRDLLEGKKKSIREESLEKVAIGLDWTKNDLISETDDQSDEIMHRNTSPDEGVPEIDIRAGANYAGGLAAEEFAVDEGGGGLPDRAIRARWGIPIPFLRDELHVRPGRVHILPIRGDSMTDALFDGDRAVVDLDDVDVSQGGIFAILDDNGSVIVKQVELVRSRGPKRIRCKSRNANYEPFELILEDPVKIIGRVACRITRL